MKKILIYFKKLWQSLDNEESELHSSVRYRVTAELDEKLKN